MIQRLKKLNRKKAVILILLLLIAGIYLLNFHFNRGLTYKLPQEVAINQQGQRKIGNYLGSEFQWFLYTPDRVPIYVKEVGKGETIVTLHGGFGMSHDYMQTFMKPFEADFHIVYYDHLVDRNFVIEHMHDRNHYIYRDVVGCVG